MLNHSVKLISEKKKRLFFSAFTLPEVLLTIGIVGVVASITIPSFIYKQQKLSVISALKKVYSTLDGAYNKAVADNGPISGWGFTGDSTTAGMVSIYNNILAPNLNIGKYCGTTTDTPNITSQCWAYGYNIDGSGGSATPNNYCVYAMLADGTSVVFRDFSVIGTRSNFNIYVDINGLKGPNRWGKDRFRFAVTSDYYTNNKLQPYGTDLGFQSFQPKEASCWSSAATYTDDSFGEAGTGVTCAFTIITLDDWQIVDTYPW